MTIDIIDLADPHYEHLTPTQLTHVRAAQERKNQILAAAEKKKRTLLYTMLENNVARSSMREMQEETIDSKAQEEIEFVRNDLLYKLIYQSGLDGNEYGPYSYPDNPDYTLSEVQRFLVVRDYYMKIKDARTRVIVFELDTFAQEYLGMFYRTLYDLLYSYLKD